MNSNKIYSFIGNISPLYDFGLYVFGYQKSVEQFVSQIPFNKEDRVKILDAGCGTGLYSLAILKQLKNAEVTAFDFNHKLVERLREKVVQNKYGDRVHLFSADIQSSLDEVAGGKFDLILTSGVLEYVSRVATITNLSRFLNPQGYFVNSPVRDTIWGRLIARMYGCRPYSESENVKAFEVNNFSLQRIVRLPWYKLASYKEVHIFKKLS